MSTFEGIGGNDMKKEYCIVWLNNNIHGGEEIEKSYNTNKSSSVFHNCVRIKTTEKRSDRVLFWSYDYDQEVIDLVDVPIICNVISVNEFRDVITNELITMGSVSYEDMCATQHFLTCRSIDKHLSIPEVAAMLKKYFDGPHKQENIARYRQMMEDVRRESANKVYEKMAEQKQHQELVEQDEEYVKRFINNLR